MLKEIFAYIRKFKYPEASLVVVLLIAANVTVWALYRESANAYVKVIEQENKELKVNFVTMEKGLRTKLEECNDSKFNDRLDKIIQLENYAKMQDTLIAQLQRLKP